MTLIGPVSLKFDGGTPDYGDFVTSIQLTTPAPVTVQGINRDYSDAPARGFAIVLTGVEQTLAASTLWRYLFDNGGNQDVPVTWSTQSDGGVSWTGTVAVIPYPTQGGQANQHGTFTITIPLTEKPTPVDPT